MLSENCASEDVRDYKTNDSEVWDSSETYMDAGESGEYQQQNNSPNDWVGSTLDDDLFEPGQRKKRLSRREKREHRHKAGLVRAKDRPKKKLRRSNLAHMLPSLN